MICFDGTSNHPKDARQERSWFGLGDIEDNGITNVLKLHTLFGGNLANEPGKVAGQHSLYYSGVGTYGNKVQRLFNTGFASSNLDVRTIMFSAGRDLAAIYQPGDRIFMTGFNRGAAIARKFASTLDRYLALPDDSTTPGKQPIRFVGLFDTVASIGVPNLDDDDKPKSDVVFEDHTISPYIEEALHLVSVDEKRIAFQPTLMNRDGDPDQPKRVTEVWFAGAHADVGGGFWRDGLSDIALEFMIDEIARRDLGVQVLDPDDIDFDRLKAPDRSYEINFADVDIKPNPQAKLHYQDRWGPIAALTLGPRDVRVNGKDPETGDTPLIHNSLGQRIRQVTEYRPMALKGIGHHSVNDDGTTEPTIQDGLRPYIM
jgi:hypothetical protein